jgi:hypothetical protein
LRWFELASRRRKNGVKKSLRTAIVTLGAVALYISASPAVAATLPEGDRVYILPCDSSSPYGFLYEVDTLTGEASRVGDWENPDQDVFNCAGPGAYNPMDGLGYWISWVFPEAYLVSVDLSTGINTVVGEFTLDNQPYYTPISLAIDDAGNAWGTSYELRLPGENEDSDVLFSVNLATAELTVVGPTGVVPVSSNYGLAWDPVTKSVYGYNSGTRDFYSVNTTTGAFSLFEEDVFTESEQDVRQEMVFYAMAFDSQGQVWGINGDIVSAPLADLAGFQNLAVTYLDSPDSQIYSESIIIAPAATPTPQPQPEPQTQSQLQPEPQPQLAATGVGSSGGIVTVAIMALLLGVASIVTSQRRGSWSREDHS